MLRPVSNQKAKIFISYSHDDAEWLQKMEIHLKPLAFQNSLSTWTDRRIGIGEDWYKEIKQAIREADVCILLISASFLASDFVHNHELPDILAGAKERNTLIVNVFVSHCLIDIHTELSKLQGIPAPDNPLEGMGKAEQNRVLTSLAGKIKEHIETKVVASSAEEAVATAKPPESAPQPSLSKVDTTAQIEITSEPAGATVYLNDTEEAEKTPSTYLVNMGRKKEMEVEIALELLGYEDDVSIITVSRGQRVVYPPVQLTPKIERKARVRVVEPASPPNPSERHAWKNEIGMEMMYLSGGKFLMGDEQHLTTISPFSIGVYPVTVEQYAASGLEMPETPYFNEGWRKRDHPMVNASWYDAMAYCQWLSEKTGKEYDLPSDEEWEFAARGGLEGKVYPWGGKFDRSKLCCSTKTFGDRKGTCPVGQYPANGYELYDMVGNVLEWCADWYDFGKSQRVLRGGSWYDYYPECFRCAYRSWNIPVKRYYLAGFRIVFRGLR
jgi:formylglycine-generating enzyme required for sulfatase activity